jgi:hypothetical protein
MAIAPKTLVLLIDFSRVLLGCASSGPDAGPSGSGAVKLETWSSRHDFDERARPD